MTSGKKGQPAFGRILVEREGHSPVLHGCTGRQRQHLLVLHRRLPATVGRDAFGFREVRQQNERSLQADPNWTVESPSS